MPDRTIAHYFNSESPPGEQACQVLAQDETGEYQLPFACHWREGAWYRVARPSRSPRRLLVGGLNCPHPNNCGLAGTLANGQ